MTLPARARALGVSALALAALAVPAACGSDDDRDDVVVGRELVLYASLPQEGPAGRRGRDVLDAARMALEEERGRAGDFTVRLVALNDAGPEGWDPAKVSENARTAAQDRKTIAYLGELEPGASAVSIPILNRAGILQVTPGDTAVGLTRPDGAARGEPEKYYPSGERTFARVVPADHLQAVALADYLRESGLRRAFVVSDGGAYGRGLAAMVSDEAAEVGVRVVGTAALDPDDEAFAPTVARIRAARPQAIVVAGDDPALALRFWRELAAGVPGVTLFVPDALDVPPFLERLGPLERRTRLVSTALAPKLYPPDAARFFADFRAKYGRVPDTDAIYGYEAINAILEAIDDAGEQGNDRSRVVEEMMATEGRRSVLGTYSIDENGDTNLVEFGGYRVAGGRPVYERVLRDGT